MYSFIHLFGKHTLNAYYRPDSMLALVEKTAKTVRPPPKKFMQGDSQENTKTTMKILMCIVKLKFFFWLG